MPVLTETDLHEALVVAMRIRICELESALRQAAESLHRAERTLCEVLEGTGASADETRRASVAIIELRTILQQALMRPTEPEGVRGRAGCDKPAEPGALSGVVPIRRDLGVRFRRRSIFADADREGET